MKSQKKGFTLVEILIVVVILGILAAIVIPRLTQQPTGNKEFQEYSKVLEYLRSNHCVKMKYSMRDGEICLRGREKDSGAHFDLNNVCFLEIKESLIIGEESMGTWTFESKDEAPASGVVWYGTRETEN